MATEKKTDYVLLGLLSHEPLTGYDIKKRIDTALKFFWSASYGSIYPTLASLEREGKVIREDKANCEGKVIREGKGEGAGATENGRDKIIYEITEKGRIALADWLYVPSEKDELRYETLLKLFFGGEIDAKRNVGHIRAFERTVREKLPYLRGAVKALSEIKNAEPAHKYYLLTAKFGVKTYEGYLEWCAEAIKILEENPL